MPFYRFDIESPLTAPKAMERIRGLMQESTGFLQWAFGFGVSFDDARPFIGTAQEDTFSMYPAARGRNSFRPSIRGRVEAVPGGTQIHVSMSLHPAVLIVALFIIGFFWFDENDPQLALQHTLIAGAAITFGILIGFFPAAIRARRILEKNLGRIGAF